VVQQHSDCSADGAAQVVIGSAVAEDLVTCFILLSGEGEADRCGCFNFMEWSSGDVELFVAEMECDILDEKRMVVFGCTRVFAWT